MGRRKTVEKLSEVEFEAVIQMIVDGKTDIEISSEFETKFNKPLPKSSFNRWRRNVGTNLVDTYKTQRIIARTIADDLKNEKDADKYQVIIENLEDFLLTAAKKLYTEKPLKLLFARQEDKRLEHKANELQLKKDLLEFEREKFERTQNLQNDKFKIGSEVWKVILAYFLQNDPTLADAITKHSEGLLEKIGEQLEQI